jgi:hypothetical protein
MEKVYEFKLEVLNKKLKQQLMEIAQLSKSGKKDAKKPPRFVSDSKDVKPSADKQERDGDNNSDKGKDSSDDSQPASVSNSEKGN